MSNIKHKSRILQGMVIILSSAIFVLMYAAPKTEPLEKINQRQIEETRKEINIQVQEIKGTLDPIQATRLNGFETLYATSQGSSKVQFLDSIIRFWDTQMRPAVSALYVEEKAELTQDLNHLVEAANRYVQIATFMDAQDKAWAYDRGLALFDKILLIQPKHADARIGKGICIVESGRGIPMEGIELIRQVVDEDPTNTRAILQLGHFSLLSGQFDKAIERYKQAWNVDTTLDEALFYIGDGFAKSGQLDSAFSYLNRFKALQKDQTVVNELEAYMKEINILSNH